MKQSALIIAAWIIILSTLLPGINHGIWRPDEPQVAGICSETARTGDFVVPRLNGQPFLEKPPLYYDVAALSGMAFGTGSDVSYRLASAAFGLLTLLIVFSTVRRRAGAAAGTAAAGILATTWGFFMLARWIQVDMPLVFFVALAMHLYLRILDRPTNGGAALLGLALGLSFMVKGLTGPALFVSALLMDMALKRDVSILWRIRPHVAAFTAALCVIPWMAGLYAQGGWPFLRETLVVNNLMRFLGSSEATSLGHHNGPFYYFTRLPAEVLPWTLLLIPALAASLRNHRNDPYLAWFTGPFILLCLSSTKRSVYLVPLYPALACMISTWLMDPSIKKPWESRMVAVTWGIAVAGCAGPLMGLAYGRPFLGIAMAFLCAALLWSIHRWKALSSVRGIPLMLSVAVAMSTSMTVFFVAKRPMEDYLAFSREALQASQGREITIYLGENEILEGVMPMVKGARMPVKRSGDGLAEGLYAWIEKDNHLTTKELSSRVRIRVIKERKVGYKYVYLAWFTPLKSPAPLPTASQAPAQVQPGVVH